MNGMTPKMWAGSYFCNSSVHAEDPRLCYFCKAQSSSHLYTKEAVMTPMASSTGGRFDEHTVPICAACRSEWEQAIALEGIVL